MAGWPSRGFRVWAAATLLTAVGAEIAIAQITWGPPYQRNYETKGPVRGYSGHVRQGARVLYCDYMRVPNRQCTIDRAGRERCRIVSWTLQQRCY